MSRRWPRALRAWLLGGCVALTGVMLIVAVLLNHGAPSLMGPSGNQGASLNGGEASRAELAAAPAIVVGDALTDGFAMPDGQVAITFDDGPHPEWTPAVLDELDRLGIQATFFVVGEKVAEHPELVREIQRRGHELGNHTHLHPEMGGLTEREIRHQLDLARLAIIDATGTASDLYRPPYSGSLEYLDEAEAVAAEVALEHGYHVIATDVGPRDFDPTLTVDDLVAEGVPPLGEGAVLTLHDGGGADRSRTVAMLAPLVATLRASGYEIVPVGGVIQEHTGVAPFGPASGSTQLHATVFTWVLRIAEGVERFAVVAAVVYVSLYVGRLLVLGGYASSRRRRAKKERLAGPAGPVEPFTPPVTVVVPAYNEAMGIEAAVRSIDSIDWPDLEILVVDDGSVDDTAAIAAGLGLDRVRVVRKANGGKASALNVGIVQATHDVIVMVDGDTLLEPSTIFEIVQPLADPDVGAVSGNPKIGNARKLMTKLQRTEYLMSSSLERRILAPAGMVTTIPGAIGAWRRSALREVGFVSSETLAEDTDLTVTIARGGWTVAYAPQARAWTEAPSTWRSLFRQRVRWTFGTLQVLWKHRRSVRDRGAGSQLGRFALPYMLVSGYLFAALAPFMDLVLLINVLLGRWAFAFTAWSVIALLGTGACLVAAKLDGDRMGPALLVPVQQIVYRPLLHAVALVTIRRAALGERQRWGAQERTGGLEVDVAAQP